MELRLRLKSCGAIYKCIPGLVNINKDGMVIVAEVGGRETIREMRNYDVFIKPDSRWEDLTYAYHEGFLEGEQLRKWP